jgi:hypothetical protein
VSKIAKKINKITKLSFWAGEMMFLGTNSDELSSTLINIVSLALTS